MRHAPQWRRLLTTMLVLLLPFSSLGAQRVSPQRIATLAPGDGIRLRIYREPELSGEYVVDDRGVVVLPRLGDWSVSGIAADSIRNAIKVAYKKFLVTESIEVTPIRRIAVTGSVIRPGLYPVDPSMSVADALILAGGISVTGKSRVVELRVAGSNQGIQVSAESLVWDTGAGGTLQLYVPDKPWAQRNATLITSLVFSTITTVGWLVNMIGR